MNRQGNDLPRLPAVTDPEVQQAFQGSLRPATASLASLFKVVGPPAPANAVEALARCCGGRLPEDYAEFLRESNGAEGCDADTEASILALWSAEEVVARNDASRAAGFASELLLIGVDGAGGTSRWTVPAPRHQRSGP